jgi:hypothetical protein
MSVCAITSIPHIAGLFLERKLKKKIMSNAKQRLKEIQRKQRNREALLAASAATSLQHNESWKCNI